MPPCVFIFYAPVTVLTIHHSGLSTDLNTGSFNVWGYFCEGVSAFALVDIEADARRSKLRFSDELACGL